MKVLQVEAAGFEQFIIEFWESKPAQRLGQAFYHHYNLDKLTNQEPFNKVWELDGDEAYREILRLVELH